MLLLALVLLCGAPLAAAPVLTVSSTTSRNGAVVASLAFRWDKEDELVASLLGGVESRIVFTARLYEKRSGLLALFGDRIVARTTVVRRASRDILTQQFVVDEDGAPRRTFATSKELLAGFLTISALTFSRVPAARRGAYVAARVQLEPVLLMPPLTLVALVGTTAAYLGPWVRSDRP